MLSLSNEQLANTVCFFFFCLCLGTALVDFSGAGYCTKAADYPTIEIQHFPDETRSHCIVTSAD